MTAHHTACPCGWISREGGRGPIWQLLQHRIKAHGMPETRIVGEPRYVIVEPIDQRGQPGRPMPVGTHGPRAEYVSAKCSCCGGWWQANVSSARKGLRCFACRMGCPTQKPCHARREVAS